MPLNAVFKPSEKLSAFYAYPDTSNKKWCLKLSVFDSSIPPPPVPPEGGSNQMAASLKWSTTLAFFLFSVAF